MPHLLAASADPMFGLYSVLRDDGSADPKTDPGLTSTLLTRMYREMRRLRMLDEKMLLVQRQGRIGFYGEVKGQEATPIATGLALLPEDWVFPALREGAVMLVRGFPLATYIAQCYGNSRDVQKGRQMPSHYAGRAVNQVAWSSCIGPQVPQAVGAAWAAKLQKKSTVVVGFMGDGATSQPDVHSALNFAGVYQVPAVLICQNNHWAISVPSKAQSASVNFASKAIAYGLPGVRVDGNDVLAVYSVVRAAIDRARRGEGPTFIESVTYRMGAHSSSDDPTRYRSSEEVERWATRDPLARFARYLRAINLLDDATERAWESGFEAEIREAITEAEAAGALPRESLFDDVYQSLPWHLREQREQLLSLGAAKAHGAP